MFRRTLFLVVSSFTLIIGFGTAGFGQKGQLLDFKPGEVIVGYRSETDRRTAERSFKTGPLQNSFSVLGGQKMQKIQVIPRNGNSLLVRFTLPPGNNAFAEGDRSSQRRLIDDLANQIKKNDPRVKYVYPNYLWRVPDQKPVPLDEKRLKKILSTSSQADRGAQSNFPNDPQFANGLQWDYQALPGGMNAIGAWRVTTGDRRIVVAVVDTGILRAHPDVVGSGNLLPGYNFVRDGAGRSDDFSDANDIFHGSNVATIIGAVATNNRLDVAGINWAVSILPVRVLNESGGGSSDDLADGILWAAGLSVEGAPKNSFPADVINVSITINSTAPVSCEQSDRVKDAIERARSAGSVIVVAAGNEGVDIAGSSPANCPGVISAAAHDFTGRLASYSNFGNVSIVAPGGESNMPVLGISGRGTQGLNGTSQAAPHVSAAIALALAKHDEWRRKPDLVAAAIRDTAVPMRTGACSRPCGPGQLDAQRLVEYVPSPVNAPLTATVRSPPKAAPTTAKVAAANASTGISGSWLTTQGEVLVIKEGEWFHPSNGTALASLVGQDKLAVRYPQEKGVTCEYRVMLLDNGGTLYLEPQNALQPDTFCPSGRLASLPRPKPATAPSSAPAETKSEQGTGSGAIAGRWLMNVGGVLVIERGEWFHPTKGAADVTLVGNDQLVVQYRHQTGVKCAYRFIVLDNGNAFELVPTINLQPDEYCPAGRLTALR